MAEEFKGVYRPRDPRATALYQILEDHFETFVGVYDDRYERTHGYWRPVVEEVVASSGAIGRSDFLVAMNLMALPASNVQGAGKSSSCPLVVRQRPFVPYGA
jgi:hypothetical protein